MKEAAGNGQLEIKGHERLARLVSAITELSAAYEQRDSDIALQEKIVEMKEMKSRLPGMPPIDDPITIKKVFEDRVDRAEIQYAYLIGQKPRKENKSKSA